MEILDKPRGVGRVLTDGALLLDDVRFEITVWREPGHADVRLDGHLDVTYQTALHLMESPLMLTLELEDGRTYDFRLMTTTGRITGA